MNKSSSTQSDVVDLSHTIETGMVTYQGLPAPIIDSYLSREESRKSYSGDTEFHIGKIEMVANTGTYIDSPFHRYEDGNDLSQLPFSSIVNLDGIVVKLPGSQGRIITAEAFVGMNLQGKAVLINTGWDHHWGSNRYFEAHPYLTGEAADFLKDSGVSLVGIDSLNIDDTRDGYRPAHSTLLEADIPIIEHMTNLGKLPDEGFKLFAAPPKIKGLGSFPVRVFAIIA